MIRFPILAYRKAWFLFSTILVVLSLFFLFAPNFGLSLGIDFTGGTEMQVSFSGKIPEKEEVSKYFEESLGSEKGEKILTDESNTEFFIRSKIVSPEEQTSFLEKLSKAGFTPSLTRVSSVGPTMGDYFERQAFWALGITILVIILFVAWAFRSVPQGISSWKFGIAAIVALIHDVFIIVGFFALMGHFINIEVDTLFVTALLTVLGFSVHDTIVVFDRLRENLKGKKSKNLETIAEDALWQTMGRSINTSVSTLIVLIAVILFGAPSIFSFVLALAFGIFIGTYSSIFIAVPLLVEWESEKK